MIKINKISGGGVMANYKCNAACRHCLYACSPTRENGYISETTATEVAITLRENGCRSVHIGGGEPLLNFDGLILLCNALTTNGVMIDYLETNGFWAVNEDKAVTYIKELLEVGVDTLCISIDPFHAEYVPVFLPLKLAELCRENGMGYFLWQQSFVKNLLKLDVDKKQTRGSLSQMFGDDYIIDTANHYGINYGGRAVNIEREYGKLSPLENLLSSIPCRNLTSTNHFHIDMNGHFIPPVCTGLAVPLAEIVDGLDERKYPVYSALAIGGVTALYEIAKENGYSPKGKYPSKCALCFDMRHYLSKLDKFLELNYKHYEASLDFYD